MILTNRKNTLTAPLRACVRPWYGCAQLEPQQRTVPGCHQPGCPLGGELPWLPRPVRVLPSVCPWPLLACVDGTPPMPQDARLRVKGVIVAPTCARLLIP